MLSWSCFAQNTNSRVGKGFTIKFCSELDTWHNIIEQNKVDYKCYIYIPPEKASMIAGNEITSITFSTATSYDDKPREGYVFVAEDIKGAPVSSTDCVFEDCYAKYQAGRAAYQTVALESSYQVKKNTGFYFGYVVKSCRYSKATSKADFPVGIDGLAPNGFSGYVDLTDTNTGEFIATVDMANDFGGSGTNMYLAATTVGDATGFDNAFIIGEMTIGDFTLPIIKTNFAEPIRFKVRNVGGNTLNTMEYNLEVNGVKGDNQTVEIDVLPEKEKVIAIPSPKYVTGINELTLNITKANGEVAEGSTNAICIAMDKEGYDRKFVVEEGTGTWCGWCPRGIVGLSKMTEKYPDSFIGIAVHSGDEFAPTSYAPLRSTYFKSGLPMCVINRDPIFALDPNLEYLEMCKDFWAEQRSPAKVDMDVEWGVDGLKVTTNTSFAYNEDKAQYRLAFALLEEGLTGKQTNYYADHPGELEWWGEQTDPVEWTFEHTARDIFNFNGISGSIPATVVADAPMTFTATLPIESISNVNQSSVVALLLESRTGVVLNAVKVEAKDYKIDPAAISQPTVVNLQPEAIYNLQGMRVDKPAKGSIVIRRINGKVIKQLVR